MEQQTLAARQFGAAATDYLTSPVHAHGKDLRRLTAIAQATPGLTALDLGCGAGHVAYALAEGGADVTAYDLSPEMLAVVAAEAERRGHDTLHTRKGPAERLPFQNASFDLVVTRLSAHHWSDVPAALREAARVLKPGGDLIVIDVISPETPLFDTILQTVEILRDPSHVRDYRLSEWAAMFREAGFQTPANDRWRIPTDFEAWIRRMRTPEARAEAILDVFAQAPIEARGHFKVKADGSFEFDAAWIQAALKTGASA